MPFVGIKMASFDFLKLYTSQISSDRLRKTMNLFNGSIAGTVAFTLTYPTDVMRRRMQVQDLKNKKYSGILNCAKVMYLEEGLSCF